MSALPRSWWWGFTYCLGQGLIAAGVVVTMQTRRAPAREPR